VVRFDLNAMRALLADAPMGSPGDGPITLRLPAPDFTMMSFTVWESAVMSIELAQAFPEIRTYSGHERPGNNAGVRHHSAWFPYASAVAD
jgi:hypothetical protein